VFTRIRSWGPPVLLIAPTLILLGIFVYGLIGAGVWTSLTDNVRGQTTGTVGLENYENLFNDDTFVYSLRNVAMYTGAFVAGTLFFGFLWAWLLERGARGAGIFRAVYLFPMAASFVASGAVWRWLLTSNTGEQASGLNRLLDMVGLGFLQGQWWTHEGWGILAIAMPAIWQLSGYVMALFLAGFRGIPEELREAARVDGATEWQLYRHVLFPQLGPVALSAVIIVGHMSLKAFDLIMAISKPANYQTKVPAIDMYVFKSSFDYANSAAVGAILLVIVAALIIPYLIHITRTEKVK